MRHGGATPFPLRFTSWLPLYGPSMPWGTGTGPDKERMPFIHKGRSFTLLTAPYPTSFVVSSCHRSLRSGSPPYDGTGGDGCEEKGTRGSELASSLSASLLSLHLRSLPYATRSTSSPTGSALRFVSHCVA